MRHSESFATEENHPIDVVEQVATSNDWEFERVSEIEISLDVEGQWREYSNTLAWSERDETLRIVSSFAIDLPEKNRPALFELLNSINDRCWVGNFSYWAKKNLIVYRYGPVLTQRAEVSTSQVMTMMAAAVMSCERYYPAIQLVAGGDKSPNDALQLALCETYGHA